MVSVSAIFNRVARLPNAGVLGDWGNTPNKHRRQLYVRAHCLRKCVAAPRYTACKTVCGPSIHCLRVCITSFWRIPLREAFLSRKQCPGIYRRKLASSVPVYTVANLQAMRRLSSVPFACWMALPPIPTNLTFCSEPRTARRR